MKAALFDDVCISLFKPKCSAGPCHYCLAVFAYKLVCVIQGYVGLLEVSCLS